MYRRLGGPQVSSGRVEKNLAPTGIPSPDRPAGSESLYRLSYLAPCLFMVIVLRFPGSVPERAESVRLATKRLNKLVVVNCRQTYLLAPWCRVLLEKLTCLQLVKKFPTFHGTRRFITTLTSVHHLSLFWAHPIQSIYTHPTSWRSFLILSTHLRLGLPSGLFPSGFPTKTLYAPISSPIRATCPAHLILLDFITRIILGEGYKSFSSPLRSLLYFHVTSSLLGPNIILDTMFSNTLRLPSGTTIY